MIGDLLLTWMSETGSGSIRDLRGRIQWMARTSGMDDGRQAAGRWLRDMSALGHCEVDWHTEKWCIAPPTVSTLPQSDGHAVLSGARRHRLASALEGCALWTEQVSQPPSGRDLPAPATVLLSYDSHESLRACAMALGVQFAGAAAVRLAARLPQIEVRGPAAPPSWSNATLEVLTETRPVQWVSVSSSAGDPPDGLFRMDVLGRPAYLYARSGRWHHCERSVGIFLELARRGQAVMQWRPVDTTGRDPVGRVFVDWGAALPPLQSRALVLCSGAVPRFGAAGRTAIYENVPLTVAKLVAHSLRQRISVIK